MIPSAKGAGDNQPHEVALFDRYVVVNIRTDEQGHVPLSDVEVMELDDYAMEVLTRHFRSAAVEIEDKHPRLHVRWEAENC